MQSIVTPRRLVIGAAAALAISLLAVHPSGSKKALRPAASTAPAAVAAPQLDPSTVPGLEREMLSAASLREALEAYERDSVYPPSSHLWTEQTAGERQPWNQPFPVEHALDDREGQETVFRFAGDRHHVLAGEALTSTLQVVQRRGDRLPIVIHSALVEAAGGGRTGIELVFRDDGTGGDAVAGDRIYTNRFVPSTHAALAQARRVRLQVDLEAGGVERLANLDFTYTPRPLLRLRDVSTIARDGSLVSSLALDVLEPGAYRFDVDVFAADGVTQIGWISDNWRELPAGTASVELSLFGKVLRDRGIAGPFVIANIRAERRSTDEEVEMFWSDPRTFDTPAFSLDAFSTEPWDGEDRARALAAMQAAIVEQERAEAQLP